MKAKVMIVEIREIKSPALGNLEENYLHGIFKMKQIKLKWIPRLLAIIVIFGIGYLSILLPVFFIKNSNKGYLIVVVFVFSITLIGICYCLWKSLTSNLFVFMGELSVEEIREKIKADKGSHGRFEYSPEGFILNNKKKFLFNINKRRIDEPKIIFWKDINFISAIKKDVYSVDQVCLLINYANNRTLIISEDIEGWWFFLKQLENILLIPDIEYKLFIELNNIPFNVDMEIYSSLKENQLRKL